MKSARLHVSGVSALVAAAVFLVCAGLARSEVTLSFSLDLGSDRVVSDFGPNATSTLK